MKYYLGGPMTGWPEYNWPAFTQAAERLRSLNFEIVSAHEIDFGETPETRGKTKSYSEYFKTDLHTLLSCDAAIFLPRWANSRGALMEMQVAVMCGMEVYTYRHYSYLEIPLERIG